MPSCDDAKTTAEPLSPSRNIRVHAPEVFVIALALCCSFLLAPSALPLQVASASRVASRRALSLAGACARDDLAAGQYQLSLELWAQPQLVACSAGSVGPSGARLSPDGAWLYVALFGSGFGSEGCRIARFDAQTLQLAGTVPTGLGPVEIAFASPGGATLGFVANSSASSVTVFHAATHAVLATVPIPPSPGSGWSTAFPAGLAVSPDQSRVYVVTNDSSGLVHVIDTQRLARLPSEELSLGRGRAFARPLFAGERLVLPTTRFHAGYQGSTAELLILDPAAPASVKITVLGSSPDGSAFPSPLDAAIWCDSELLVCGFDLGRRLFALDPASGALAAEIALPTSGAAGSYYALEVSPDGLIALSEFLTNELVWVDAATREVLGMHSLSSLPDFHTQLNELVFLPGHGGLVATGQYSDTLAVFSRP